MGPLPGRCVAAWGAAAGSTPSPARPAAAHGSPVGTESGVRGEWGLQHHHSPLPREHTHTRVQTCTYDVRSHVRTHSSAHIQTHKGLHALVLTLTCPQMCTLSCGHTHADVHIHACTLTPMCTHTCTRTATRTHTCLHFQAVEVVFLLLLLACTQSRAAISAVPWGGTRAGLGGQPWL